VGFAWHRAAWPLWVVNEDSRQLEA
jgi:hypothetical protein